MPEGSNIQDAEMMAIWACLEGATERTRAAGGDRAPTVLVLSDCLGILITVEKAWRGGSAWELHRYQRAGDAGKHTEAAIEMDGEGGWGGVLVDLQP